MGSRRWWPAPTSLPTTSYGKAFTRAFVSRRHAERVLSPLSPVGELAPPDAVYEPSLVNGFPTWESLLAWVTR